MHVMQAVLHAAWGLEPDTPCYRLDSLAPAQPCRRLGLQVLTDVAALRVRYIYVTRCRKRGLESILITVEIFYYNIYIIWVQKDCSAQSAPYQLGI